MVRSFRAWIHNLSSSLLHKGSGRNQNVVASDNTDTIVHFYSFLSHGLDKLGNSLVDSFLTLNFYGEAMNLLKSMQSELLVLVEKLNLPVSPQGQEWLDQYMDESAFLLDLCNLLKSSISFLQRYRMMVELLVHGSECCSLPVDQKYGCTSRRLHSFACEKAAIDRFESEKHKFLQTLKTWKDRKGGTGSIKIPTIESRSSDPTGFAGAMAVVENIILVISSFLLSVLVCPLASTDMENMCIEMDPHESLGTSLSRLHQGMLERGRASSISGLAEYNLVENAVSQVKLRIVEGGQDEGADQRLSKSIDLLRQSSVTLKEGLDMFDYAVNDVFIEVIKGRDKLLRTYSANM